MTWPLDQLLEAWAVARTKYPAPGFEVVHPDGQVKPAQPPDLDDLAGGALGVAIQQLRLGCGEIGGNNMGPDVARYIAPAKCPQNWCGAFAGWCYQEAARQLGIALPFQRSLGAKRLGANVAAVGRRFTDPAEARPGDLMVFDRGAQGSWMGHVAMIESVGSRTALGQIVATVEGNAGPKVMRRERWAGRDRFSFFASIRRAP